MAEHPIQGLMDTAMSNIKSMVDVNTIVGEPVTTPEGATIVPISRVSFGFGAGGSEFSTKQNGKAFDFELSEELFPFGGGSGGGINISPVAFLRIYDGKMDLLNVEKSSSLTEKLFEIAKDYLIDKKRDN